jgi:hypothetical protein
MFSSEIEGSLIVFRIRSSIRRHAGWLTLKSIVVSAPLLNVIDLAKNAERLLLSVRLRKADGPTAVL